jgi:hypothetical protein
MGVLRCAVGALLFVAPRSFLRLSSREAPTGAAVLLLRTIGIRDLVLGTGTVLAARHCSEDDLRRWTTIGAASDSLDVVTSVASFRTIGKQESVGATLAAAVFVVGDLLALRSLASEAVEPGIALEGDCLQ